VARVMMKRLVPMAAAIMAATIGLVLAPSAAIAAPAAKPSTIEIVDKDKNKYSIHEADHKPLFARVLGEFSWMATATPTTTKPANAKLGDKYTVTVLAGGKANQVYDIYPLAAGGPRAYRPASQPTGKKAAGWFYGRLTMSESMRIAGVPIEQRVDVVAGGIGGGVGKEVDDEEMDAVAKSQEVVGEFQRLFLLNGAVLVIVLAGLAGVAFLIRRRV
jgi:hypothetical protein